MKYIIKKKVCISLVFLTVVGICVVTSLTARNMNSFKLLYDHGFGNSVLRKYFAVMWKHHSLG